LGDTPERAERLGDVGGPLGHVGGRGVPGDGAQPWPVGPAERVGVPVEGDDGAPVPEQLLDDGTPDATGTAGHHERGSHIPTLRPRSTRQALASGDQWLDVRWPRRRDWIEALASFSPTMRTVFPRAAYFVVTASRAATDDASHTCASDMSITISAGSPA
jgi:hypothetical protein